MTMNGKILLGVTIAFLMLGFCASRFGGTDGFRGVWMALLSLGSLVGAIITGSLCLADTLLENEE